MKKLSILCLLLVSGFGCGRGGDDDGGGGDNGGSDGGGDGDDTIFDIQSDAMPAGTAVTVRGVVVTAIDTYGAKRGGIYVAEPEGGAFSGVYVYLSGTEAADLAVGNLVDLEGFVKDEFSWQSGCEGEENPGGVTELSPAEGVTPTVTKVGDGTVPAPEVLQPWDLAASAEEAEKWEGVLVTFENSRVLTAPSGDEDKPDQTTMWVTGPFTVQASLTELGDTIAEGDCYSSITGIGDYFFDYKILPRSAADLVAGEDGDCLPVENTLELCGNQADDDHSGQGDCADFGCQDAVESCTIGTTVADIQTGEVARNSKVRLSNVVITGVSFNKKRYWVSEDVDTAAPNTGIYVYRPNSADALDVMKYKVGAKLSLVANVDEQLAGCSGNALTELTFVEPTGDPTGSEAGPAPMTVDLATLASDTAGEPYEGVLVKIEKVAVTEIHEDKNDQGNTVNYEFAVSDGTASLMVDDDIYRRDTTDVGDCLTIIGIMHYNTFDNSGDGGLAPHITIEPRAQSEVVTTTGCN
jgi:hypothetical protein